MSQTRSARNSLGVWTFETTPLDIVRVFRSKGVSIIRRAVKGVQLEKCIWKCQKEVEKSKTKNLSVDDQTSPLPMDNLFHKKKYSIKLNH